MQHSHFARVALLGAAFFGLILTGCDSADLTGITADGRGNDKNTGGISASDHLDGIDGEASDGSVDLVAGQNIVVGTVSWVKNDVDGSVEVTYQTNAPYCISEWHLDGGTVGSPTFGIPTNNPGSPKIGNFQYGETYGDGNCQTTVVQTLEAADFEGDGARIIAAHAVVVDDEGNCNYFYGIASDGNIYEIRLGDLMTAGDESETLFHSTGLDGNAVAETWPNSLALNDLTGRLYYSNALAFGDPTGEGVPDPTSPLYFYDEGAADGNAHAGDLSRRSASGTFAGGEFWYVPQNLDDNLRRVTFNGDGTIASDMLVCGDFTGDGSTTPMFYGDIAYDPDNGLIYGSVRFQSSGTGAPISTFFSLNPASCAYTPINTETFLSQLTIDCAGNLIGFNTSAGIYYLVDRETGAQTPIGNSELAINDLAPGECECEDFDETAWGAGSLFRERGSWAMYITID